MDYGRRYLTVDEAAAIVGVSRRTIYNWMYAKRVTVWRTPSGSPRIDRDSLMQADEAYRARFDTERARRPIAARPPHRQD
jgi:excisionase family DNA binding protein